MSIETFKQALAGRDKIQERRLSNWGYWGQLKIHNLDPATWTQIWNDYIRDNQIGRSIAEQDAQELEDIITGFNLIALHNDDPKAGGAKKWGHVWFTCLKIKYLDPERPVSAMAQEARIKLKRPMAERTFQHHIQKATDSVFMFAEPL